MNLYIKYDVYIALQVIVQQELNKLNVPYRIINQYEINIEKNISQAKYMKLEASLKKYGIEIIENPKNILVQRIKNLIVEMVFSDEYYSVKTSVYLASKLDYDYKYLSNLFAEINYFTIQHFIILQKLERAKQLMIENKMGLKEIAWMLQYSSVAHLSAQFKKSTGLTPTAFQRILKKRKIDDDFSVQKKDITGVKLGRSALHMLLADDDADDRLFFKEAIEAAKIDTKLTTFKNGVQLMTYLNKPNVIIPDIIFLDLNMPRKGGEECLTEIRNNSKLRNVSIAIYSTSSSEKDIEATFVNGANIYINKPTDMNELKKLLIEVVRINWQFHKSGLNRASYLLNK